jgi:hypothetical protein
MAPSEKSYAAIFSIYNSALARASAIFIPKTDSDNPYQDGKFP